VCVVMRLVVGQHMRKLLFAEKSAFDPGTRDVLGRCAENVAQGCTKEQPHDGHAAFEASEQRTDANPLPWRWFAETERGGDDEGVDTQRDDERDQSGDHSVAGAGRKIVTASRIP